MSRHRALNKQICPTFFHLAHFYENPSKFEIFRGNLIVAMVQVEDLKFLSISDDETNLTIGFVTRSLVAQAIFVKF